MAHKTKKEKRALRDCKQSVSNLVDQIRLEEKSARSIGINELRRQKKERRRKVRFEKGRLSSWLTLDNAGIIYPSLREENWDFVYRISAVLTTGVDPQLLQRAVDDLMPRFPSFFVRLKAGFFWNYFEGNNKRLLVEKEEDFPCARFKKGSDSHLIRVIYYKNRVSVECFHALADGRSTLKFLNSLIKRYIELLGVEFTSETGCLNYLDKPKREELEDAFTEYVDNSPKLKHGEVRAFCIKGTPEEFGVVNSTIATISVSQVKEIARQHDCKLFEFIIATLGFSIWERAHKNKKNRPIKISVPVDLRQFFESETLRNFSGYLNVEIPVKDDFSLEECIGIVKAEMRKINKPFMQSFINSNVGIKSNPIIKIIPLFIKNIFINLFFKLWGERYQTLAVSNLGMNVVPNEFDGFVNRFEFNVGRPKYNAKSMGIISYGDKMVCVLSSKIKENRTEKDFLTNLSKRGVKVLVESNRRDLYE